MSGVSWEILGELAFPNAERDVFAAELCPLLTVILSFTRCIDGARIWSLGQR